MKHLTNVTVITLFVLTISQSVLSAPPDRRESQIKPSIGTHDIKDQNGVVISVGADIKEEMSWAYRCFAIRNGKAVGCTLLFHNLETVQRTVNLGIKSMDCDIDAAGNVVPNTCASGGHQHATPTSSGFTRPQTRIYEAMNESLIRGQNPADQAPLEAEFLDSDNSPLGVAGFMPATGTGWKLVKFQTPDNAGSIYWEARVQPPPCYFLPQLCGFRGVLGAQDNGEYLWDGSLNVGFQGLIQLPDNSALYAKVRGVTPGDNDDMRHLNKVAFAGTGRTLTAMELIAFQYNFATPNNLRLRINDMGLPFGGLFDVRGEYKYTPGGHRSHRDGQDVDLNRTVLRSDGSVSPAIQCENDRDLFFVVNQVLAPVPGRIPRNLGKVTGVGGTLPPTATALLCERLRSGSPIFGRKHIDITQIVFPPFNP